MTILFCPCHNNKKKKNNNNLPPLSSCRRCSTGLEICRDFAMVASQKYLASKSFCPIKNFGPKKFRSRKYFGWKKNYGLNMGNGEYSHPDPTCSAISSNSICFPFMRMGSNSSMSCKFSPKNSENLGLDNFFQSQ